MSNSPIRGLNHSFRSRGSSTNIQSGKFNDSFRNPRSSNNGATYGVSKMDFSSSNKKPPAVVNFRMFFI